MERRRQRALKTALPWSRCNQDLDSRKSSLSKKFITLIGNFERENRLRGRRPWTFQISYLPSSSSLDLPLSHSLLSQDLEAETYLEQQQEQQQQQQNPNPNPNTPNPTSILPTKSLDQATTLKILAAQSSEAKTKSDRERRKENVLRREKGFCEEGVEGDGY